MVKATYPRVAVDCARRRLPPRPDGRADADAHERGDKQKLVVQGGDDHAGVGGNSPVRRRGASSA
ncbi:MAG: hypothetical protein R2854_17835 [Caldilineaceae bacterium]